MQHLPPQCIKTNVRMNNNNNKQKQHQQQQQQMNIPSHLINNIVMMNRPTYRFVKELNYYNKIGNATPEDIVSITMINAYSWRYKTAKDIERERMFNECVQMEREELKP